MTISSDDVRHVARLARLDLTEEEIERFRVQLGAVLERAQRIRSLPLDDVPPTAHPLGLRNVLRPDEVVAPADTGRILDVAPDREGDLFRVPRVLEDAD